MKKGVYLLPNSLTLCGMFAGFYSIIATFTGEYVTAAWAILIATIFDGLDGWVARLTVITSYSIHYTKLYDTAADRQQRHAGGHGAADQRQGGCVALRGVEVGPPAFRALIMAGLDIRDAAGDQNAVETRQHDVDVVMIAERGNDNRLARGAFGHRPDVFLACRMKAVFLDLLDASWDADQGMEGHGNTVIITVPLSVITSYSIHYTKLYE